MRNLLKLLLAAMLAGCVLMMHCRHAAEGDDYPRRACG